MPLSQAQFINLVKARQGGLTMRAYAKELGITPGYLSDVYLGRRDVGPTLSAALHYKRRKTTRVEFVRLASGS